SHRVRSFVYLQFAGYVHGVGKPCTPSHLLGLVFSDGGDELGKRVPGDLVPVTGEGATAHISPAQPQPLSSAIPIHTVHAGGAERRPVPRQPDEFLQRLNRLSSIALLQSDQQFLPTTRRSAPRSGFAEHP